MTQYTDVMLDLETVGTAPGSGIIAIGAVAFAPGMPEVYWTRFEVPVISRVSCAQAGLTSDMDTLEWWTRQAPEARTVYDASLAGGKGIAQACAEFAAWFPPGAALWGNGANFDNVLLRCAFTAVRLKVPWAYYDDRCFRTMKKQFPGTAEPAFVGVKHNALADAMHQTRWLQAIWNDIRDANRAHDEWKTVVRNACPACANPQMNFDHLSGCMTRQEEASQ